MRAHIDPVRDLRGRCPRLVEGVRVEAGYGATGEPHRSAQGLARQGRLERPGRTHGNRGTNHAVYRDVVRVAVAAGRVVADDGVRPGVVEDPRESVRHLAGVHVCEAVMLTVQARVGIPEMDHLADAKHIGRCGELRPPPLPESVDQVGPGKARLAARCSDHDDPVARGNSLGHRAAGEQRLIVGMGVAEDQGVRHGAIVAYGRRVRIVHISDCYPPRTGGIESQVHALASRQQAAGDDITVITATPGATVRSGPDAVDGVRVQRLTARLPGDLPVHPRAGRLLREALRTAGPVDAVHVHAGVVSPFAWSAVRASTALGLPTLVTVHCVWGPGAAPAFRIAHALTGWARWGARIAAVSSMAAARIEQVPDTAPVLVLPNGIDPDLWRVPAAATVPGVLRVATVMRLAPRKRAVPLVRILARAQAALAPIEVRATIVGDGPTRTAAERAARSMLPDGVTFTGRVERTGILRTFAESDVFCLPSVREAFGLAALEARTAGLPVVARSQTGAVDFVTDGVTGLLADDDAGMAGALVRLARDRDLLHRISVHNRTVPPDQQWPHVLDLTRAAYAAAAS